jgi:hypothetical protein
MHKLNRVQLESDGISYNRLLVSLGSASAGGKDPLCRHNGNLLLLLFYPHPRMTGKIIVK